DRRTGEQQERRTYRHRKDSEKNFGYVQGRERMTNYEKYKDQLMFILMDKIGFDPGRDAIVECEDDECDHCMFYADKRECFRCRAEWLNAEAKESKEF